jgi:hypothetical protein
MVGIIDSLRKLWDTPTYLRKGNISINLLWNSLGGSEILLLLSLWLLQTYDNLNKVHPVVCTSVPIVITTYYASNGILIFSWRDFLCSSLTMLENSHREPKATSRSWNGHSVHIILTMKMAQQSHRNDNACSLCNKRKQQCTAAKNVVSNCI